jgi:phage terminase large subunit-like protein
MKMKPRTRRKASSKARPRATKKAKRARATPHSRAARYIRDAAAGRVDDRATRYAANVAGHRLPKGRGRIVAGPWVRLACARHLKDLERTDYRWDLREANHKIAFFEKALKLNGGAFEGKPFLLEPWECFIVGSLFGWKRLDGTRRFRRALIETGKGSGKSPLLAGIGLIGATQDNEPRAEVYFAAPKKDQAYIPFRDAVAMVDLSPVLSKRIQKSGLAPVWNLAYPALSSFLRPISSDERQSGPRPHMGLLDELHEHGNSVVVDMMLSGAKGRRQPLIIGITNSGFDRQSVCWQWHEYSMRVLQRVEKGDDWFAYVCALDEGDDPFADPSCWVKANPNLGVTIPQTYLEEQVALARAMPTRENLVRRLNFCQWTEQSVRWMPMERWDASDQVFNVETLRGRPCFAGLDLSSRLDLTGLVLEFPPQGDEVLYRVLSFPFIPEERLRLRMKNDAVAYDVWIRQGHLFTTPGDVVDQDAIRLKLLELAGIYKIVEVCYDDWNATQLQIDLQAEGLTVVPIRQGYKSLSAPMKDLEVLVMANQLSCNKHPAMRWCVANVSAATDPAGNIKPDKEKSRDRIDLLAALITAHARAMVAPIDAGSVYESRGVLAV